MKHPDRNSAGAATAPSSTIGVVIPAFNAAAFLPKAIESVLHQTHVPDEIIVVDDGSTDGTEALIANFALPNLRYIRQSNQGSAAARNAGVRALTSDFVAFLDTDDQWLPSKTALQLDLLEHQPEIGMVSGDQIFWDPERSFKKIRRFSARNAAPDLVSALALSNVIGNPSMVMARRSLFDEVGHFDPQLRYGDDWDMWLKVAAAAKIAFVPEPVAVYRWHGENQSRRNQVECLRAYRKISLNAINASMSRFERPFAYPFLFRHTMWFMRYKALRSQLGHHLRRFGLLRSIDPYRALWNEEKR